MGTGQTVVASSVSRIFDVVNTVRLRWRWARVLRGAAITVAGVVVLLVVAAFVLDQLSYSPGAVIAGRVIIVLAAVALLARFVVLPLRGRPRDPQVALYVEEHEPTLGGALMSAVEISQDARANASASHVPGGLAEFVRRSAIEKTHAVGDGRRVDARALKQGTFAVAAGVTALVLLMVSGPERLRNGMGALLTPWTSAEEVNPFRIDVRPGSVTVARGASVLVSARTVGFQADGVELFARRSDSVAFTRVAMAADSTRQFTARLFDVAQPTEYYVETNGVRSRVYKLDVADLPYAKRIDLLYTFPAYTGLPTQRVDSAGDIAALVGTTVRVRVTPTLPTPGGRLVLDGGDTLRLTRDKDGALVGTIRVAKSGFYRVELEGSRGDLLTASLDYAIDALPDRAPSVRFVKPGRDAKVLAVDEVFTEAEAEDDYGVAKLDLVYSVNGAPEKTVALHQATSRVIREIAAGHTFMLEDYALQPGDVVSYYARVADNDAVQGAKTATSDIYFLNVRPYAQEYRQSQQGGGGGGGGNQAEEPGQLSQRQREIIAGTFNSARDSAAQERRQLEEDVATLRLAQQRLREDAQDLTRNLRERGVAADDSNFARIAQILPLATAAMDTAERALTNGRLHDALQPEQRALTQLQRAEAVFRNVRVQMGGQGGGGGGGGQQPADDLADLFELQQDRMRNQYETVQRPDNSAQQSDQQVDATAERLRQLAARQQQENERARRKADSLNLGASGSGNGGSQRQLAQEAEEAARQLERLARERESESLAEAARRLNEAADAMRRSASSGSQRNAASAAAMDRLKEASRLLDAERNNRVQRAAEDAAATGRRLAEEQRQVNEDVERETNASGQQRDEIQQRIAQRKGAMADTAKALAGRLDRAALGAQRENAATARELEEAADTLRARRIEDKLRLTQNRIREIPPQVQQGNERIITSDIEQLNRALEEARVAAGKAHGGDAQRSAEATDRARDLVRGMESLEERMRQLQEQRSGSQAGQGQSKQGQQGQGQQSQGQSQGQQGQGPQGQQGGQPQAGQQPGGTQGNSQGGGSNQSGVGAQRSVGQPGGGGTFARELRERLNDARALRRDLAQRGGVDLSQLDRAITNMQRLSGSLADERAMRELPGQVVEGLRSFEFSLGRALGTATERVLIDRSGEVPPEYRKYVEEYYRSLGRAKPR